MLTRLAEWWLWSSETGTWTTMKAAERGYWYSKGLADGRQETLKAFRWIKKSRMEHDDAE